MANIPTDETRKKDHAAAARDARRLAQSNLTAVLSTLSKKLDGMPFGSVSPVMLSDDGDVIFYVSDIAQHARNLMADSRLSVTFFQQTATGDQNQQGRLTLNGQAVILDKNEAAIHASRFWRLFPEAQSYTEAHDFRFWRLNVQAIRWIGGFGKIYWLDTERWHQPLPTWNAQDEHNMVEHMNKDHADACQLIVTEHIEQTGHVMPPKPAKQLSVYPEGCHFSVGERRVFVPFNGWCHNSQEVRKALVAMTHQARDAYTAA